MALFNLTDIKFKRETRGDLNPIVSSKFTTSILKYPIDIGTSYDKGHYMVIYVNEQENTAEEFKRPPSGDVPEALRISKEILKRRGATSLSQTAAPAVQKIGDALQKNFPDIIPSTAVEGIVKRLNGNTFRTVRRTTDAIALYMPDTLNFVYNQGYSDVSTNEIFGKLATAAAGASVFDDMRKTGFTPDNLINASSVLLQGLRDFGVLGQSTTLGLAALGQASNPGLELLYTSPSFRSFRFDFMFYPRSQVEAKEVIKIINKLKFHQAPEIVSQAGGRFLVPPSEFDIQFFYNGFENPNIPKVSTCVLEVVDVDYAPNGFSAYEVPGSSPATEGGTGMPTAIRLSLQFKETQIVTKEFLTTGSAIDNRIRDNNAALGDFLG